MAVRLRKMLRTLKPSLPWTCKSNSRNFVKCPSVRLCGWLPSSGRARETSRLMCKEENEQLKARLAASENSLESTHSDVEDILAQKQSIIQRSANEIESLKAKLLDTEKALADAKEEIARLQAANAKLRSTQAAEMEIHDNLLSLQGVVSKQDGVVTRLETEISELKLHSDELAARLMDANEEILDLRLKCAKATAIRSVFGQPCMLVTSQLRLVGALPPSRDHNSLIPMNNRTIVLYGGERPPLEGAAPDLFIGDLEKLKWDSVDSVEGGSRALGVGGTRAADGHAGRVGHTCTQMSKNKLAVIGGRRNGDAMCEDVNVFNIDTMKWTLAILGPRAFPLLEFHAAIGIKEQVYVFGGARLDMPNNPYSSALYMIDFENLKWKEQKTMGLAPSARVGHSMCVSENGKSIWLFGGHDGASMLNDLFLLETARNLWNPCSNVQGELPSPRRCAAIHVAGKYLFVHGGCDASQRWLSDTYILDTKMLVWQCLDEGMGADGAAGARMQPYCQHTFFQGQKVISFVPVPEGTLTKIQVMEFTTLSEMDELRRGSQENYQAGGENLVISPEAVITPCTIELSWWPPKRKEDRIESYKLMMATSMGVVKEIATGNFRSFKVTGLRPSSEYIFSVKVTYTDGTHLWSDSRSFCTTFRSRQS